MDPEATPENLEGAVRAAADTLDARALAASLRALDEARWVELLPVLRSIARKLAAQFEDIAAEDDVLGELALRAHERWIADWAAEVSDGHATRSLWVFLHDRLRDHLREARRTQARRRALIGLSGADERPGALFLSAPITPEEDLAADELRDIASGSDAELRAILALREAGYSQAEISKMLAVSRPTVTRRLAAVAIVVTAIVAALIAIAIVASDDAPIAERAPRAPVARVTREHTPAPPRAEDRTPATSAQAPILEPPVARLSPIEADDRAPAGASRGSGVLELTTDVTAAAFLDGVAVGMTPLRLALRPGTHDVELRRDGYGVERFDVVIRAGQTTRVFRRAERGDEREPPSAEVSDLGSAVEAEARRCTMDSDNLCVIRLLEGNARTEAAMAMLIEAYRARGQTNQALRWMRSYVERFPGTARARNYQQILARSP